MKIKICLFVFLVAHASIAFCQADVTVPVRNVFKKDSLYTFPLQLLTGRKTHLPETAKKLVVIAFLSPECPLSKNYSGKLAALKNKYSTQVNFIAIIPGTFAREDVADFKKRHLSNWTILRDSTLQLTHYLQGEVTPEVLVINNKNARLVYKGAIDDWVVSLGKTKNFTSNFYLDNALNNFLNNKQILISYNKPVGCLINDF